MRASLIPGLILSAVLCLSCKNDRPAPPAPRAEAPPPGTKAPPPGTKAPPPGTKAEFARLRDALLADWFTESPDTARRLGLHEYDGKVPDFSAAGLARGTERWQQAAAALDRIDRAALPAEDQLDLDLLRRVAARVLFERIDLDQPHTRPFVYLTLFGVNSYLDRDYAPLPERARRLLAHEEAALLQVPHVRENLRPPLSRPMAEVAGKLFAGSASYLRTDVVKRLQGVGDEAFRARFARVNEELAAKAAEIGAWLVREVAPAGNQAHVLGPERYRKLLLVQEGLTLSIHDFKKMGEDDLLANKRAYEALAGSAKEERPPIDRYLKDAAATVEQARGFVTEHHVVTLASPDTAIVRETPPYKRWNLASLDSPGPFEQARTAYYDITLPDPAWPRERQQGYVMTRGTLLTTTVHEVYPGHMVQLGWAARAPSRVQKVAFNYSFVEGWAHYTEQMMIEQGFGGGGAAVRLAQLQDALLRDCRFVVSVGIHTEGMTIERAEQRFMQDCHQPEALAHEQALRGTFDPGYFAYTLGKLQILSLRQEARQRLGDRFSLQRFHDALLAHGSPPVTLIRERVLRDLGVP